MTTPTDPYSSPNRQPMEENDILGPLADEKPGKRIDAQRFTSSRPGPVSSWALGNDGEGQSGSPTTEPTATAGTDRADAFEEHAAPGPQPTHPGEQPTHPDRQPITPQVGPAPTDLTSDTERVGRHPADSHGSAARGTVHADSAGEAAAGEGQAAGGGAQDVDDAPSALQAGSEASAPRAGSDTPSGGDAAAPSGGHPSGGYPSESAGPDPAVADARFGGAQSRYDDAARPAAHDRTEGDAQAPVAPAGTTASTSTPAPNPPADRLGSSATAAAAPHPSPVPPAAPQAGPEAPQAPAGPGAEAAHTSPMPQTSHATPAPAGQETSQPREHASSPAPASTAPAITPTAPAAKGPAASATRPAPLPQPEVVTPISRPAARASQMPQTSPYDVGASGGLPPQTASAPPTAATFSTNSSASAASTASAITSASAATPSSHADPRDLDGSAMTMGEDRGTPERFAAREGQSATAGTPVAPSHRQGAAGDAPVAAGADPTAAGSAQAAPADSSRSALAAAAGFGGASPAEVGSAEVSRAEASPAVDPASGAAHPIYGPDAAQPRPYAARYDAGSPYAGAPRAEADSDPDWSGGHSADHPEQTTVLTSDASRAGSAPADSPDQTVRLDAAASSPVSPASSPVPPSAAQASQPPSAAPATQDPAQASTLASPATTPMPTPASLTPTTAASAPSTTASPTPDSADAAHSFFTRDSSPTPDDDLVEAARGRGWAHVGTFVATLVLVPVVWYLLSDASIRLSYVMDDGWQQGTRNFAAIGELAGGVAAAALLWHLVRYSSLGAQLIGVILAAFGLTGLLLPQWFDGTILDRLDSVAGGAGNIGENAVHHLRIDVGTGRLFVFGAIVFLTGFTAHYVRRRGHRDGVANADRGLVAKR